MATWPVLRQTYRSFIMSCTVRKRKNVHMMSSSVYGSISLPCESRLQEEKNSNKSANVVGISRRTLYCVFSIAVLTSVLPRE